MPKLTPQEAFEVLVKLNPGINFIEVAGGDCILASEKGTSIQSRYYSPNIDWGDATSYKPEQWRPATIEDLAKSVYSWTSCRVRDAEGRNRVDGLLIGGRQNATGSPIAFVDIGANVLGYELQYVEVRGGAEFGANGGKSGCLN